MENWQRYLIKPDEPVAKAIELIDYQSDSDHKLLLPKGIALVVNDCYILLGIVTDGDLRKSILRGITDEAPVEKIMNQNYCFAKEGTSRKEVFEIMRLRGFGQMPILNSSGQIVGLELLENFKLDAASNWVVLMAGGLGTRLGTLTQNCPKPLIEICGKPVLETILTNFINFGFKNFFIIVNFLGEKIIERIGNSSKWGVNITYLIEEKRFGTAGGLSLLPEKPKEPVIVMNSDVLTKLSILHLLDFHKNSNSIATMCVREYDVKVPFGVAKVDNSRLVSIEEKPIQRFFVNAGIYVLNPEAFEFIPKKTAIDMPDLFKKLIEKGLKTSAFPIREYWIDIGRIEDLQKAGNDYSEVFND